ncbi:hypothetical protein IJ384_05890 [bacterium]|nr:hypothetical protein [bacterium]
MKDLVKINYNSLILNFKKDKIEGISNNIECLSKEQFLKDNNVNESIFNSLDLNKDGYITKQEINIIKNIDNNSDGIVSEKELQENRKHALDSAMFSARRNIDKWFSIDINRDGKWSNVEDRLAEYRMAGLDPNKEHQLDSSMTHRELEEKYNDIDTPNREIVDLEWWIEDWIKDIKKNTKEFYGVDLSEAECIKIKKEMIKQLNTWMFKTGDNETKDAPLYNSLNSDSYTRLITDNEGFSCCGGDITPPPATNNKDTCTLLFREIRYNSDTDNKINELKKELAEGKISESEFNKKVQEVLPKNSADEIKNRLAWAIFPEPEKVREIKLEFLKELQQKIDSGELTEEEAANEKCAVWSRMDDEEYEIHHEQYKHIRNMTASDFRDLLKPENETNRIEFEKNSWMTVSQIVQYIDIVESEIESDFDSSDWEIDCYQFSLISSKVNGTQDDENLLSEKTLKDIPENRQSLLKFLQEKGWLLEQFK